MFTSMHNAQECFIVIYFFICIFWFIFIFIVMKPSSDCKETYQLQKKTETLFYGTIIKVYIIKICNKGGTTTKAITYTILPKVLAPLLMKGLTTLVISMSTNLNVSAYNDILGSLIV